MKGAIVASVAALVATVSAQGSAIVINNCASPVSIQYTPASGGGASQSDTSVASGASSSQQMQVLDNGAGWSLKIFDDANAGSPMQFEYTLGSDNTVFYDMSFFNGDGGIDTWAFSLSNEDYTPAAVTSSTCVGPADMNAFFAYNNQYGNCWGGGMQPQCGGDVDITLTLCPNDGGVSVPEVLDFDACVTSTLSSGASPTAASTTVESTTAASTTAASTTAEPTTTAESTTAAPSSTAESTTSTSAPAKTHHSHPWADDAVAAATTSPTPSTTLVTAVSTAATTEGDVVWVTDVAYVTAYVTAAKRDVHHHQHHARHPHGLRA